jgi:hypothetical protein
MNSRNERLYFQQLFTELGTENNVNNPYRDENLEGADDKPPASKYFEKH